MIDKRKLKSRPIHALKDLVIEEVSLVDRSANEGAEVLIWKRLDLDASILNSYSVEKLTKAMESIDYKKIGVTPEELWADYASEVMQIHNTELGQKQKNPPERLTPGEVEELRLRKPWTLAQATAAARKTNIGQGLWAMVESVVREREAALINRLDKMIDETEGLKKHARETIEIYDKMKIERMKMGTVVEKILSKAFLSQVEAIGKLKLDLVKSAKAGDERTPEKRLDDYLVNHSDVAGAIQELPTVVMDEPVEKRDFGPTYAKIQKLVDELIFKGEVSSRAKGFMKVVDSDPSLLVEYYKEQL